MLYLAVITVRVPEWLTGVPPVETRFPSRDLARAALDSDLVTGQIFVVNGKNSVPTRESTDPRPVMAIFGGTTETRKEIVGGSRLSAVGYGSSMWRIQRVVLTIWVQACVRRRHKVSRALFPG